MKQKTARISPGYLQNGVIYQLFLRVCTPEGTLRSAMKLLPQVTTSNDILRMAASISIALEVDGHRADITLIKTAETLAAVDGRTETTKEDLREAARLALPHRMRRRPFEEQKLDWETVDKVIDA